MPRARCPESVKAEEMYHAGMALVDIAKELGKPEGTVRRWKHNQDWEKSERSDINDSERSETKKKKHGAQPSNQNAVGHGAPKGNQNARKHGLFSRYLPQDTLELFNTLDEEKPLDLLWDQIKVAYAAIIRAQQIMFVDGKEDKTIEKVAESYGDVFSEKWEVQQAWDKQGAFLTAQAKAQAELRNMIKQYDELLHKNWNLATDEQKARIEQMKAKTEQIKSGIVIDEEEGIEIINDAPKETGENIGDCDTEVSTNIQ